MSKQDKTNYERKSMWVFQNRYQDELQGRKKQHPL